MIRLWLDTIEELHYLPFWVVWIAVICGILLEAIMITLLIAALLKWSGGLLCF